MKFALPFIFQIGFLYSTNTGEKPDFLKPIYCIYPPFVLFGFRVMYNPDPFRLNFLSRYFPSLWCLEDSFSYALHRIVMEGGNRKSQVFVTYEYIN